MTEKILKELKINKLKILFFLIGYFIIILDYKIIIGIEELFKSIDLFYLIIFNFIFIFLMFSVIKKTLKIYAEIIILKNDKKRLKFLKFLKIISLGSFIGFISMIFQGFILILLPF